MHFSVPRTSSYTDANSSFHDFANYVQRASVGLSLGRIGVAYAFCGCD